MVTLTQFVYKIVLLLERFPNANYATMESINSFIVQTIKQ